MRTSLVCLDCAQVVEAYVAGGNIVPGAHECNPLHKDSIPVAVQVHLPYSAQDHLIVKNALATVYHLAPIVGYSVSTDLDGATKRMKLVARFRPGNDMLDAETAVLVQEALFKSLVEAGGTP